MSYILDALRKSEQERSRGLASDLLRVPIDAQTNRALPSRGVHAILAAVFLAFGVGLGWWQPWNSPRPEPKSQPAPAAQVVGPALAGSAPAPQVIAAPRPAERVAALPEAKPAMEAKAAASVSRSLPRAPVQGASANEKTTSPKAAAATGLPPPPGRVLALAELPQPLRDALPPLAIQGFAYANDAPSRSVVIGERVFREGDEVAAGLRLEGIEAEGIVLNFKGYRFRAPK